MEILIDERFDKKTVKEVVYKLRISTRLLTRLKGLENGIEVNGKRETVRYVLKCGDVLSLAIDDLTSSTGIVPFPAPVEILWEDDWYIALAKPPHIPTHPARRHQEDTLASRMAYLKKDENFVFRAMTRLDLDTSGVVIIAKNQLAANEFSHLLIERRVKKEYTAVCLGKIPVSSGVINEPIFRPDPLSILRATGPDGDEAVTEFTLLKATERASLVSVSPVTGRTHQIRVHFKHLGFPVLADTLYSSPSELIDRQALHASKITFIHPFTKNETSVFCPLFPDMENCINELFGD